MSHRKRISTAIAVAAATLTSMTSMSAASPAANRILPFTTVTRGTVPWKLAAPSQSAWAQVVNRVIDAPGQGEQVDFRRYFGVYAYVMKPTSGYSLTFRRIVLQRFGGYSQICVIATVQRPSGAVTQERSMSAHYVKVKRGRLGFNVPDHIVLRERRAALLYATPGSRSGACRA